MNQALIIVAVLNFLTTSIKCGINLEIVQNTGDSSTPLYTNKVKTTSDRNVSLTCKIVDSENSDNFDNEVVWGKKGEGFKIEILGFTNLSFAPIKLKNRGRYFCLSLKYGAYKIIYIIVKLLDNFNKSKRRWKRADVKLDSPSTYSSLNSTGHQPIPLPTDGYYNFDWSHETYTLPAEIKRLYKETQHQQFDYSNYNQKNRTFFGKRDISYAGVIVAVVAIILIVGALLYRLMKRFDLLYAISPERISEVEPECRHPTCGQYCTFAMSNNGENAQNSYSNVHNTLGPNATNNNVPPLRVLPSMAGLPNSSERNAQINTVDLPPSYDNSVKNCDKYDLPPSYNEALSYMSVSGLPQGFTQNLPRNM